MTSALITVDQTIDMQKRQWSRKIRSAANEIFEKVWEFLPVEQVEPLQKTEALRVKLEKETETMNYAKFYNSGNDLLFTQTVEGSGRKVTREIEVTGQEDSFVVEFEIDEGMLIARFKDSVNGYQPSLICYESDETCYRASVDLG